MAQLTKASEREVRFAHRRMTHCASEDPVSLGPWASQAPASRPPECSWPWDMLSLAHRGRGWLRPPRISEGRELLLWDAGCVRQPPRRNVLCFEVPLPPHAARSHRDRDQGPRQPWRSHQPPLSTRWSGRRPGPCGDSALGLTRGAPAPGDSRLRAGSAGSIPRRWPKAPAHGSPSAPPSLPEAHLPPRGRLP